MSFSPVSGNLNTVVRSRAVRMELICGSLDTTDWRNVLAQKVTTHLIDDLSGDVIEDGKGRTVSFAFDGTNYEIDLAEANLEKLREALSDYIASARKVSSRGGRLVASSSSHRTDPAQLTQIREWAAANGYEVAPRGRISAAVREAYDAAH